MDFLNILAKLMDCPGRVNDDEQDGVKGGEEEDREETERQTKFKLKFKVIHLHHPLSHAGL